MYEQPEDISLELIQLATPLAIAAMAENRSGQMVADNGIQQVIVACGDIVKRQFERIRLTVDHHSSPANTELLAIKLALLRAGVQSASELLSRDHGGEFGIEQLIADIDAVTGQCVGAVCQQYEVLQKAYFERSDSDHPLRRPHTRGDY